MNQTHPSNEASDVLRVFLIGPILPSENQEWMIAGLTQPQQQAEDDGIFRQDKTFVYESFEFGLENEKSNKMKLGLRRQVSKAMILGMTHLTPLVQGVVEIPFQFREFQSPFISFALRKLQDRASVDHHRFHAPLFRGSEEEVRMEGTEMNRDSIHRRHKQTPHHSIVIRLTSAREVS